MSAAGPPTVRLGAGTARACNRDGGLGYSLEYEEHWHIVRTAWDPRTHATTPGVPRTRPRHLEVVRRGHRVEREPLGRLMDTLERKRPPGLARHRRPTMRVYASLAVSPFVDFARVVASPRRSTSASTSERPA